MSGEPEHGEVLARIDQIGHPIYQPSLKVQGRLCLKSRLLLIVARKYKRPKSRLLEWSKYWAHKVWICVKRRLLYRFHQFAVILTDFLHVSLKLQDIYFRNPFRYLQGSITATIQLLYFNIKEYFLMIKIYLIKWCRFVRLLNIFEFIKWTGSNWFFRFYFFLCFRLFLRGCLAGDWTWLWSNVIVIEENSIIDCFEIVIT